MEGQVDEFQDWEVLLNNINEDLDLDLDLEGIQQSDSLSGGINNVIRSDDYFSFHSQGKEGSSSVESLKESELDLSLSDSSIDHRSQIDRQFNINDYDVKNELVLGFPQYATKNEPGFQGIGEIGADESGNSDIMEFQDTDDHNGIIHDEYAANANANSNSNSVKEELGKGSEISISSSSKEKPAQGSVDKKKRSSSVVWWKLPLELLNYCVFRVNPLWTFSLAAAVMGFVFLGRRFHKLKRKTRSLQLNVTVDDKKVSQFMSRAARLNEAFSVVRRVPVIRPALPPAGVTPWPVLSLR